MSRRPILMGLVCLWACALTNSALAQQEKVDVSVIVGERLGLAHSQVLLSFVNEEAGARLLVKVSDGSAARVELTAGRWSLLIGHFDSLTDREDPYEEVLWRYADTLNVTRESITFTRLGRFQVVRGPRRSPAVTIEVNPDTSGWFSFWELVQNSEGRYLADIPIQMIKEGWDDWITTSTSIYGMASFGFVPPGRYRVRVELPAFKPYETERRIGAGEDQSPIELVLATEETTEVRGNAIPAASPLTAATYTRDDIERSNLSNGRTLQSFAAPGMVETDITTTLAQFSAMGQRRLSNRMSIDGISADLAVRTTGGIGEAGSGTLPAFTTTGSTQALIPIDAIEEIAIHTTNAPADRARAPGAITSVISRAGGERLQVTAFGNIRPNAAADWFTKHATQSWIAGVSSLQHETHQREQGATIGGPLVRERINYFAAFEHQQISRPVSATVQVPAESTRAHAAPDLRSLLDSFPRPNGPEVGSGLAELTRRFRFDSRVVSLNVRLDGTASPRHRVFLRANGAVSTGDAGDVFNLPPFGYRSTERSATTTSTAGLNSIHASGRALHELRANVSVSRGVVDAGRADFGAASDLPSASLIPGREPADVWLSVLAFGAQSGVVQAGEGVGNVQQQVQLSDTWIWSRGAHTLKFGGDYIALTASSVVPAERFQYRFASLAALLQRQVRGLTIAATEPARARISGAALFVQDDYRPGARLSLSFGLRYAVRPAPTSLTSLEPLLLRYEALPAIDERPAGTPMWRTAWTNFAPSVATAFQLRQAERTPMIARAGWSIVYDELGSPGASAFGRGYPYVRTRFVRPSSFPASREEIDATDFAPFATAPAAEAFSFADLRTPRTMAWNVGIDQEFGQHHRLSVGYAGATGRDLIYSHRFYVGDAAAGQPVSAFTNDARSDYQALILDYTRRPSSRWNLKATYALSSSTDTDSGEQLTVTAPPSLISPESNRGASDFDRRHNIRLEASYRIASRTCPTICRALLDGLQLDAVAVVRSGAPFSVSTAVDSYEVRPDLVAGAPLWLQDDTAPGGRRLNAAAFRTPSTLRQGTLPRNVLRALPLRQLDVAISRSARLGRATLTVRLSALNVLNLANFGIPYGLLGAPDFGRARTTYALGLGTGTLTHGGLVSSQQFGGPRALQLALRIGY